MARAAVLVVAMLAAVSPALAAQTTPPAPVLSLPDIPNPRVVEAAEPGR